MEPAVFVGSSSESLDIAYAVASLLQRDARTRVWTSAFELSHSTMQDLQQELADVDFGVFVLGPDDEVDSRGELAKAPRDNVILEFGMIIGRVGLERSFLIVPSDIKVKLPSDLVGIKPATYKAEWARTDPAKAVNVAAGEVRKAIRRLGARSVAEEDFDEAAPGRPPLTPSRIVDPDGWRSFAAHGRLPEVDPAAIWEGMPVVHPKHGLGTAVAFGPAGGDDRTVTVRFADGLHVLAIATTRLYLPDKALGDLCSTGLATRERATLIPRNHPWRPDFDEIGRVRGWVRADLVVLGRSEAM